MDGTRDSEKLLDLSVRLFNQPNNQYNATFINGIRNKHLEDLFEIPSESLNYYYSYSDILDKILHTEQENSNEFIERFINKCEELNIRTRVYLNENDSEKGFASDSMFSDLLVIGKSIFTRKYSDKSSIEILESTLSKARCPILLLPNESPSFKNIVILFDGTQRSFDAIKLFVYLSADQLKKNKVILFTIVNEHTVVSEKNVCDYLKVHQPFFSVNRIYPDNYYNELLSGLSDLDEFLLVSGVSRQENIEDVISNRENSFYLKGNRSVFML
ncbi:MAG TPA: hypothetical protein VK202_12265 [Bacteroidia bacterium]|nr:hypothetical protein [Bacteroidia bacterium]